jgi:hypothetical protein
MKKPDREEKRANVPERLHTGLTSFPLNPKHRNGGGRREDRWYIEVLPWVILQVEKKIRHVVKKVMG